MKINNFPIQIKNVFGRHYQYIKEIKHGKRKSQVVLLAALLGLIIWSLAFVYSTAYEVKVNGKVIGIVKNEKHFSKVLKKTEEKLHNIYGTEITFDEEISFQKVKVSKKELIEDEQLQKELKETSNFQTTAFAIKANGNLIAAIPNEEDATKALEQVKAVYVDENNEYEKVDFLENVTVEPVTTKIGNLKTLEQATNLICKGTEEIKTYQVAQGETLWTIAKKYELNVDDLIKANPDVNPEELQIDQTINLIVEKPLLTVTTIEKIQYQEPIPFEVEIEETPVLLKGEQKIKSEGKEGIKEVVAEIEKHNGVEVSKNVLEEEILENPQNQVVLQGTRTTPPETGTGSLDNPTRGRLTSRFGWRWGRKHAGIDVAARIGTPVCAADGGKVVFAGTQGGYGKFVIIDHGEGLQTCYAHNSKIVVSKGQTVYKGQKISEVGNTGRSTGPHLHFEVRKNGVPVNPLKYVNY